ncbi:MAG: tetratricopeptide repeat protein [Acidobacteriaceae bacterium]
MLAKRSIVERRTPGTARTALGLGLVILLLAMSPGACAYASEGVVVNQQANPRSEAEWALMQGEIDEAVGDAERAAQANPGDGEAYMVLCRSYYAEQHADEAIGACLKAAQELPHSSEARDWLGRAYGMKADHAGPIAGLSLALKVKAAFEAAVAMNPRDGAAVNDLSEFYIDAPAIIGGGLNKESALADQVQGDLPQQAHRMRALAAEKQKDYGTAEREFKAAVGIAGLPNAWVDLGAFYRRRGQYDKSVDTLKRCLEADRAKDASLVDAASVLNKMHREQGLEEKALREYLEGGMKSDAAPAMQVHVMLGRLLASEGNKAGAKIEFDKALQMASGYAPAKQALQSL